MPTPSSRRRQLLPVWQTAPEGPVSDRAILTSLGARVGSCENPILGQGDCPLIDVDQTSIGESGLIPCNLAVTIIRPFLEERVGDEKT